MQFLALGGTVATDYAGSNVGAMRDIVEHVHKFLPAKSCAVGVRDSGIFRPQPIDSWWRRVWAAMRGLDTHTMEHAVGVVHVVVLFDVELVAQSGLGLRWQDEIRDDAIWDIPAGITLTWQFEEMTSVGVA